MRTKSNVDKGCRAGTTTGNEELKIRTLPPTEFEGQSAPGPANLIRLSAERHARLPGYDRRPSVGERLAFGTLHLVAVAVIGLTAYDSLRFAMIPNDRDLHAGSSNLMTAVVPTNAPARPGEGLPKPVQQTAGLPRVQSPKS